MISTHVEQFDHPDDPDISIQFTGRDTHHCIDLTQDETEQLVAELRGVVE